MTPKQHKFATAYIETGNASAAYRQAYDCANMQAQCIHNEASKLLEHPAVAARIAELQAEHGQRHRVNIDTLLAELEQARQLALANGQAKAAIEASVVKGRLMGLFTDKAMLDRVETRADKQFKRLFGDVLL